MTKQEYIESAAKSAKNYIKTGLDAQGRRIRSPKAYLAGTISNAKIRYENFRK